MKKINTIIILAGGQSKRMGIDKQTLCINKKRLIYRLIEELSDQFDQFIIVTNKPQYYDEFSGILTKDHYSNKGPLAGIHAGLVLAEGDYALVLPCDMPFVSPELIRYQKEILCKNDYSAMVNLSSDYKLDPFPGFYSRTLINKLEDCLKSNQLSMYQFLEKEKVYFMGYEEIKKFINPDSLFTNLNTPIDLREYLIQTENKNEKFEADCN